MCLTGPNGSDLKIYTNLRIGINPDHEYFYGSSIEDETGLSCRGGERLSGEDLDAFKHDPSKHWWHKIDIDMGVYSVHHIIVHLHQLTDPVILPFVRRILTRYSGTRLFVVHADKRLHEYPRNVILAPVPVR